MTHEVGQRTAAGRRAFELWLRAEIAAGRDPSLKERRERWGEVVRANREDRLKILEAVNQDNGLITLIVRRCSQAAGWQGCVWWIDHFGNTWDPRKRAELPFVLYEFQIEEIVKPLVEFILAEDEGKSVDWLIEKCRDMGATWVVLAVIAWAFVFVYGFTALIGAQTEETVDDGGQNSTADSLMGRIRYILRRLPAWLWKPLTLADDKSMSMKHPLHGGLIMGSVTNANFGRHGRFKLVFVDEAAWLGGTGESLRAAHDACSDTSRLNIFNSTPNGMNYFGALRHGLIGSDDLTEHEDGTHNALKITTLRWDMHPEKDSAWLARERKRRTPENFAQNVMIDYKASVKGLVFHEFNYALHVPTNPAVDFFPALKFTSAYDPGRADAAAFQLWQADPFSGLHYCVFYIERTMRVVDWFVPFYLGYVPDADHAGNLWQHSYTDRERAAIGLVGEWYARAGRPEINLGDQAGWQKTQNYHLSAYAVLARYGITIQGVLHDSKREAVEKAQLLLRSCRFARRAVEERWGDRGAKTLQECFTNYRWPAERDSGMMHPHQSPLHGPFSHGMDAFQIYAARQQIALTNVPLDPETRQPANESFLPEPGWDRDHGSRTQGGRYSRRSNLY